MRIIVVNQLLVCHRDYFGGFSLWTFAIHVISKEITVDLFYHNLLGVHLCGLSVYISVSRINK
jgi:hypothetical protein